jgi:DNA polymerase III delta prime subunit
MKPDKRQVPTGQKESLELKLKNRLAYLSEKGIESPAIDKDPIVKHLKADIRAINSRLKAIDALEKKDEELAKRKIEKAAAPKEASEGTKKKKEEAAPAEGKEKKKKKE